MIAIALVALACAALSVGAALLSVANRKRAEAHRARAKEHLDNAEALVRVAEARGRAADERAAWITDRAVQLGPAEALNAEVERLRDRIDVMKGKGHQDRVVAAARDLLLSSTVDALGVQSAPPSRWEQLARELNRAGLYLVPSPTLATKENAS